MPPPMILSTWSFGSIANAAGWPVLSAGGSALDAVERACVAVEADESVNSVGIGGLPDAAGHVSLDGCIMLSPERSAGVACVRHHAHVVSIARLVMERTPHKLLVGDGADDFADACGLPRRQLLTEAARSRWAQWQSNDPAARDAVSRFARGANREEMLDEPPRADPNAAHDTVGVLALDAAGTLAGACSTSGMAFKLPGRVGDSPILGHGLYVDRGIGAAVATGRGELMMGTCAAFLAVECLARGLSPAEAVASVIDRLIDRYALASQDQCGLIVLAAGGQWSGGALRPGFKTCLTIASGTTLVDAPARIALA